jgi:hypothetical protein
VNAHTPTVDVAPRPFRGQPWLRNEEPPLDDGRPARQTSEEPPEPVIGDEDPHAPRPAGGVNWLIIILGTLGVALLAVILIVLAADLLGEDEEEEDDEDEIVINTTSFLLGDRYEVNGYSLRYPEEWEVIEGEDGAVIFLSRAELRDEAVDGGAFRDFSERDAAIFVTPDDSPLDPEAYLQEQKAEDEAGDSPYVYGVIDPREVAGHPAAHVDRNNADLPDSPQEVLMAARIKGQLYRFIGYAPEINLGDLTSTMLDMAASLEVEE